MTPQTWMVPRQKYDVIHYIREAFLKPHNPGQYARVDRAYLDRLPKGTSRGPEPSEIEPWVDDGLRPEPDGDLRSRRATGRTSPTRGSPSGSTRGRGACRAAAPGWSTTTTRSGSRPPGPARASSTGTASTSTASTRSIPRSSAGSSRQPRRARLGQPGDRPLRRPARSRPRRPALRPAAARLGALPGPLPPRRPGRSSPTPSATAEVLEMPGLETDPAQPDVPIFTRTLKIGRSTVELTMRVASPRDRREPCAGDRAGASLLAARRVDRAAASRRPASSRVLKVLMSERRPEGARGVSRATRRRPSRSSSLTHGGPARWPEVLKTQAVDRPRRRAVRRRRPDASRTTIPGSARCGSPASTSSPDGRSAAVCTWDGDVWLVDGRRPARAGADLAADRLGAVPAAGAEDRRRARSTSAAATRSSASATSTATARPTSTRASTTTTRSPSTSTSSRWACRPTPRGTSTTPRPPATA